MADIRSLPLELSWCLGESAVPSLARGLSSKAVITFPTKYGSLSGSPGTFSALVLGRMGQRARAAVPQLISRFTQDGGSEYLFALAGIGVETSDARLLAPQLVRLLRKTSSKRSRGLDDLGAAAVKILSKAGLHDPNANEGFLIALGHMNEHIQWQYADALCAAGEEAIPVLSMYLARHPFDDHALEALAKIGGRQANQILANLIANPKSRSSYAILALGKIGKPFPEEAIPTLIAVLDDEDHNVCGSAVDALQEISGEKQLWLKRDWIVWWNQQESNPMRPSSSGGSQKMQQPVK